MTSPLVRKRTESELAERTLLLREQVRYGHILMISAALCHSLFDVANSTPAELPEKNAFDDVLSVRKRTDESSSNSNVITSRQSQYFELS